eukprot:c20713_g1_i1 orf=202-1923(+)
MPAMAFASCKHISQAPVFLPDFEKLQEVPLPRISFVYTEPPGRLKSKSSSAPPHAVKAPSSHLSSCHQGVSVVTTPTATALTSHAVEADEDIEDVERGGIFLTELKRSELESQWACTDVRHRIAQREMQGKCGRLSARQRRILARRREYRGTTALGQTPPQYHVDAMSASSLSQTPHHVGAMSASLLSQMPTQRHVNAMSAPLSTKELPQHHVVAMSASLLSQMRPRHHVGTLSDPLAPSSSKESLLEALQTVNTLGFMKGRVKQELLTKEEEALLSKKMKLGQNLRAVRKRLTKTLGYEPSDELWAFNVKLSCKELQSKLIEADRARDYMFLSNLRLVISVAKKYSSFGISLADLAQEGAAGLLRGLEKFDHKRGFKLSTYVHWWIRQRVTQALGEHSKTVRIPPYMHAKLTLVNRTMAEFKEDGIPVSVRNLSKALNMPDEIVSVALKATKKIKSLDRSKRWGDFNSSEEDSMHNYIADPSAENNPWNAVDNMFLREHLDVFLTSTLCKREQDIVRLYYGFDCPSGHGMSFQRIGQKIGISRERTRQVEGRALRKLVVAGRQMDLGVPLSS